MSTNIANFSNLSELISLYSRRKPQIVLDPEGEYCIKPIKGKEEDLNVNIICDRTEWKIPENISKFVEEVSQIL